MHSLLHAQRAHNILHATPSAGMLRTGNNNTLCYIVIYCIIVVIRRQDLPVSEHERTDIVSDPLEGEEDDAI